MPRHDCMTRGPMMYLIRHAETLWNRDGRFQGQLDSPLTTRGLEVPQDAIFRLSGGAVERIQCISGLTSNE
jgi:broad specificity phosphatase PhoE